MELETKNSNALACPVDTLVRFCKLYETEIGQILVKADTSEDGAPEVRFYFKPAHLGICSMAITFEDNDSGWDNQEKTFDLVTQESAIEAVNGVLKDFPMQT
jgi:hypothetical protein